MIQLDGVYWFDDVCPIVCFLGAIRSLLSYNVGRSMFFSSKARIPYNWWACISATILFNLGFVSCGLGACLVMCCNSGVIYKDACYE